MNKVDTLCENYNDILNISNHAMKVLDGKKLIVLKNYKNNPRTSYTYADTPKNTWELTAAVDTIKGLPIRFQGKRLVVSRETLRAVNEMEVRMLKTNNLWVWLLNYKNKGVCIKTALKKINSRNIERSWPEFNTWVYQNIPENEHKEFLRNIKKYVVRDDLLSPGPRVKDKAGEVIACRGLMSIDSFWKDILW